MRKNELSGYSSDGTDGPTLLKTLRETSGLSQLELALRLAEANVRVDQSHLHKIETGKIARPSARVLEAILTDGLQAPYTIRKDAMEAFGYRLPWTLPNQQEIESGRRLGDAELNFGRWPAYMLDFAHRIWAWNPYFPRLLGNSADDPENDNYWGLTVLDILLNPEVGTNRQIANAGTFVPVIVGWYKTVTRPYANEEWAKEFMLKANSWPGFREIWNQIPEIPPTLWSAPNAFPVEIQVPGYAKPLVFRPMNMYLALDPRFSLLHLVPMDLETMEICLSWEGDSETGDEPR